jgi:hypothetical protein
MFLTSLLEMVLRECGYLSGKEESVKNRSVLGGFVVSCIWAYVVVLE